MSDRNVQLGDIPPDDPSAQWFAVRNVFRRESFYEERITIWNAPTFEEAERRAMLASEEQASALGNHVLSFAQIFHLFERPADGAEVFSLIRASELDPDAYLSAFFDTGSERQGTLESR
jgi:hypothetical protein